MQIYKQRRTPPLLKRVERIGQAIVVGLVDAGDALIQLCFIVLARPQLSKPRNAARDKPKAAPRTAAWCIVPDVTICPAGNHRPINVIRRAVKINHRPRRMSNKKHRACPPGNFCCEQIGIPILKTQNGIIRMAHPVEQFAGISAPGVRHGDKHWNSRGLRAVQGKCRRAFPAGNIAAVVTT